MDIFQKKIMEMLEEQFISNHEHAEDVDIEEVIEKIIPDLVGSLRESLSISAQEMLNERRHQFSSFTKKNEIIWKEAFDILETHIAICTEGGESINAEYRPEAVKNNDLKFDILVRHHARACHIANEILCLLKNGFADAAHARWRALHEVNVTAIFIEKHGQECAKRFYFHDVIDSYDGMKEHKKYENRLQEKAPDQVIIDQHKLEYDKVIQEFGQGFECHYGWAAYIFPSRVPRTVGFATLEKDVGLDHMRPYYKWASQNVHAGAKGMRNRLALTEYHDDILVVGQSNYGMTDPAHATALSLMQITLTLLKTVPNINHVVLMNVIQEYSNEVGNTFLKVSRNAES